MDLEDDFTRFNKKYAMLSDTDSNDSIVESVAKVQKMYEIFEAMVEEEDARSQMHRDLTATMMRNQALALEICRSIDDDDRRGKDRKIWCRPELLNPAKEGFWETVVPKLSPERFQKKFRLSRATFDILCGQLHDSLFRQDTNFRAAIPVPKRIAIALYYLKTNCVASVVADVFKVGESTVSAIMHQFCDSVNKVLFNKYVKFPDSLDEKKAIADDFMLQWQFPKTFGALDATHIPIVAPKDFPEDYYNCNNFHSIVLLALVDAKGKFIYTNIGRTGLVNDSLILEEGSLKSAILEKEVIDADLHIIGDGAFPLLNSLMKPYSTADKITAEQENFNRRINHAQSVVEDALDRLKGRFRILMKKADFHFETVVKLTKTCVVLHNICEVHNEKYWPTWNTAVGRYKALFKDPVFTNDKKFDLSAAREKREKLCRLLHSEEND